MTFLVEEHNISPVCSVLRKEGRKDKPDWRGTQGLKYQIFAEHVDLLINNSTRLRIDRHTWNKINDNFKRYHKEGYYTDQCICCQRLDGLVNGLCEPCFKEHDMEYEDVAK